MAGSATDFKLVKNVHTWERTDSNPVMYVAHVQFRPHMVEKMVAGTVFMCT